MTARRGAVVLLLALASIAGTAGSVIRLDSWDSSPPGRLNLKGTWRPYPGEKAYKHAPEIVREGDRTALVLRTEDEPMRIGRAVKIEPRETPWLTWEWKVVTLPAGGDLRDGRRNDQAGRVSVMFEGMKGLLYVWDTSAPVGTESRSDGFELFQRTLIAVRSGREHLGQWDRQRHNVYEDYRRVFKSEPRTIKLVGLESHSNDTHTRTEVHFGAIRFDAK